MNMVVYQSMQDIIRFKNKNNCILFKTKRKETIFNKSQQKKKLFFQRVRVIIIVVCELVSCVYERGREKPKKK